MDGGLGDLIRQFPGFSGGRVVPCRWIGIWLSWVMWGMAGPMPVTAGESVIVFESRSGESGTPVVKFIWDTVPGVRYVLESSGDLKHWEPISGGLILSDGVVGLREFPLGAGGGRFFRAQAVDEQPPTLSHRYPAPGAFAIDRRSHVRILLEDASGVDPESIRLRVGDLGEFRVGDPGLTYSDGELIVSIPEGIPRGEEDGLVRVELVAADVLGHAASWSWAFHTALDVHGIEGLFVFGSRMSQLMGQRLDPVAAELARRLGHPPPEAGVPGGGGWRLDGAFDDRLVIVGEPMDLPTFRVGQRLANLAPVGPGEMFYREVVAVDREPGTTRLTLRTQPLVLEGLMVGGSRSIGSGLVPVELDSQGRFRPVDEAEPGMGVWEDLSGMEFDLADGSRVVVDRGRLNLHGSVRLDFEMLNFWVDRVDVELSGEMQVECVARVVFAGGKAEATRELQSARRWYLTADPLPLHFEVRTTVKAHVAVDSIGAGELRSGLKQSARFGSMARYHRNGAVMVLHPEVVWERWHHPDPSDWEPVTGTPPRSGQAVIAWVPGIDISMPSVGRAHFSAGWRLEVSGSSDEGGPGSSASRWESRAGGDLDASLAIHGFGPSGVSNPPRLGLFSAERQDVLPSTPPGGRVLIRQQPRSQDVRPGGRIILSTEVQADGEVRYQWHHRGIPLPGENGSTLVVDGASDAHEGEYFVRVISGSRGTDSTAVRVTVTPDDRDSPCQYQDRYPYSSGEPGEPDPWGFPRRECTSYVAWRIQEVALSMGLSQHFSAGMRGGMFGTAAGWDTNARVIRLRVDTTPRVGAVAHWGAYEGAGSAGHVAWVESVNPDGSVQVSEYDIASDQNGFERRRFNVRCNVRPPRFLHVFQDADQFPPEDFAWIPEGAFEMGDALGDSVDGWGERPVHTVWLSGFLIGRTEVTGSQWWEVRTWGLTNGYPDVNRGYHNGWGVPVDRVSWYDVAKWCNALSEREGLDPVYWRDGEVFRSGSWGFGEDPGIEIRRSVNGFRMPSEAEWEKAARGGLVGRRFPWGDTISHEQANYYSEDLLPYDIGATRGYHPGSLGGLTRGGMLSANGYGLYDMAGNVLEWCNDWWDGNYYGRSPGVDPEGAAVGRFRVTRGGAGTFGAFHCRTSVRRLAGPDQRTAFHGFRLARSPGSP